MIPRVANDGASLAGREHSASVTWVGHATVAVHDDDDVFLTDPHFGERALVPRRVVPPGLPLAAVPADAFAVISHNHYDHLDAGTVERLPDTRRVVRAARARGLVPRARPRRAWSSSTGGRARGTGAGRSPACRRSTGRAASSRA